MIDTVHQTFEGRGLSFIVPDRVPTLPEVTRYIPQKQTHQWSEFWYS